MDQSPLVTEQIDAGAKFLREFSNYLPIRAAFWLLEDGGGWDLYVISDGVTDDNFDVAYGEVLRITAPLGDQGVDPFRVRLLRSDEPLTRGLMEVSKKYPGPSNTKVIGATVGGVAVDAVFVYPQPEPTPV